MSQDKALENPDLWDWDKSETRPPVKNRRVVLSVAFKSDEFQRVASHATKIGKRTSEFVRDAALNAASETHPNVIPFHRTSAATSSGASIVSRPEANDPMTSPSLQYQLR
jgi:hypothetical protein